MQHMAHTIKDQKKILDRVKRIQGQLNGIQKAVEGGENCSKILQTVASVRGAVNGLMGEIVDGHIRDHIVGAKNAKEAAEAGEETIAIMKSFWK